MKNIIILISFGFLNYVFLVNYTNDKDNGEYQGNLLGTVEGSNESLDIFFHGDFNQKIDIKHVSKDNKINNCFSEIIGDKPKVSSFEFFWDLEKLEYFEIEKSCIGNIIIEIDKNSIKENTDLKCDHFDCVNFEFSGNLIITNDETIKKTNMNFHLKLYL